MSVKDLFRTISKCGHGLYSRLDSDAHVIFCVTLPIPFAAGIVHSAGLISLAIVRHCESEFIRKSPLTEVCDERSSSASLYLQGSVRFPFMPTSSSDSEGTSQQTPRRRSTPRSTASRPATRSRRKAADEDADVEMPAPVADDDFGSGVSEEKAARETKPARRSRSTSDVESTPAGSEVPPRRERKPRREPPEGIVSVGAETQDAAKPLDRLPRGERTPNRLERQIADVESQTGMRYFSTDELDFGDDEHESPPSRSRPRYSADEPESRDSRHDRDDFDRGPATEDNGFDGDSGDGPRHRESVGDAEGVDRRPKRRRRRRRRPEGTGFSEAGDANQGGDSYRSGDENRNLESHRGLDDNRNDDRHPGAEDNRDAEDIRGGGDNHRVRDENRGSEANRNEARNDAHGRGRDSGRNDSGRNDSGRNDGGRNDRGRGDSGRPQGSNRHESGRQDGGRGRRPGGSGGGSGSGNRGRRNEGSQPRGGTSSRDSGGRGSRDRGMPRRNSRQVQASVEVVEGTYEGVLELHSRGYGFMRDPKKNYAAEDSNPFVSSSLVEKYKLREGVLIRGDVGNGTRNQGPRLREVELIDGYTPEAYADIRIFDTLTAINPFEQIRLEVGPKPLTMRVMDLLCPIGKGQRALLVAPPRTGKTMLLQDIANSVSINHPEIYLMVLLIDERPEEVTEMRRMVKGEVISSSLDSDVESHVRISQLIIERAKRLAEEGKDVFILLDSITRMARAFNKWSNTGRTATGGLDIRALDIPKKLFGQARRFDEGGSLTVCGTALIDTGSRMDEAIFQEFKGTGNMEMVLSRDLADRRIWPSIDISKSGTRREEKILEPELLEGITMLRRSLVSMSPVEAMEQLTKTMDKFPTNAEFLKRIKAVL